MTSTTRRSWHNW